MTKNKTNKTDSIEKSNKEEATKELNSDQNKEEISKFLSFLKELLPYIIILIVVVLIRSYVVTPIMVNGPSMEPTLNGGEIMILNKLGKIDRYDIVVVDTGSEDIIKRVIAMPGETISCEEGIVYVNGRRQDEEYSDGITSDFDVIKLADDEYFVMGDNREDSLDSRKFGAFKEEQIKGTTNLILLPFKEFGKIK